MIAYEVQSASNRNINEPGSQTLAPALSNFEVTGSPVPYICLAVCMLYGGSVRIKDLNLGSKPATVFVRGEYTKTKADRVVSLTEEVTWDPSSNSDVHTPIFAYILGKDATTTVERKHLRVVISNIGQKVAKSCSATIKIDKTRNQDGFCQGRFNIILTVYSETAKPITTATMAYVFQSVDIILTLEE